MVAWAGPRFRHPFDLESVRADPSYGSAHGVDQPAELLDVGLGGGVANRRHAVGESGRHDRVLGPHHAHLVKEDIGPDETAGCAETVGVGTHLDFGPQRLQGVNMGVQGAAADPVAAGPGKHGAAVPREQGTGEQKRRSNLAGELCRRLVNGNL